MAGRDGKTGQTCLKVVLASAFKARSLFVDGWYSLNLLGNSDGENLMNPAHAFAKLKNKTELLDDPVASLELAGRQSLEYLRPILGKAGLLL